VAFLGLHVPTAVLDPYVTIGWAATVLPFASPYRALAIGLGALAVDLAGAVLVTSLARSSNRPPPSDAAPAWTGCG
jgi:methionine sulfoxide reductase heme-binding subunit